MREEHEKTVERLERENERLTKLGKRKSKEEVKKTLWSIYVKLQKASLGLDEQLANAKTDKERNKILNQIIEVADLLTKLKLANEKIIELEEENKKLKTEKEETSEAITKLARKAMDGCLDYCEKQFRNEIEGSGDEEAKKTYYELKEKGLTDREIMTLSQMEEFEAEKKYEEIIAQINQVPK